MPPHLPRPLHATHLRSPTSAWLAGLLVCTVGGALCALLSTPLPWMIGPLVAMAVFRFSGAGLAAPKLSREVGQFFIAITLGLYFTPAVAREVWAHWPLLLASAFAALGVGYLAGLMLGWAAGIDRATAYFASVPGGASEMASLGDRYSAQPDKVAVAHSLRILLVVCTIPVALALAGVQGSEEYRPVRIPQQLAMLPILFALAAAVGVLFQALRVPNAWMLGPLVGTIAVTAGGLELSAMPAWLTNAGQVLLACWLGQRFERRFLADAPRFLASLVFTIYATMGLACLVALGLMWLTGLSLQTLILATAPGGIAEMAITAQSLKLGVALVTAAHVVRVLVIISCTLPLYQILNKLGAPRPLN